MWNFFEQPWTLLGLAIIASIVLWIFRAVLPEKCHWWQWLLPPLLVLAAFGLDFLVETDLEKINAVINTAVKAVEDENCDAIEAIISDNYRDSYHGTKERLMFHCRSKLAESLVEKNIKRIVAIDIQPQKATAVFTMRILFDKRSFVYQNFKQIMLTKLKLDLQKQLDNQWLITRAELLEIDMQPAGWKDIKQATW